MHLSVRIATYSGAAPRCPQIAAIITLDRLDRGADAITNHTRKPKAYTGDTSVDYLEPGSDERPFDLATEIDWVEPSVVPISADQEERGKELLDQHIVISLHNHPFVTPDETTELFAYDRQGRQWTGYEGLSLSRLDVIFGAFLDGVALMPATRRLPDGAS